MTKKISALFLVISLLFSCGVLFVQAETTTPPTYDESTYNPQAPWPGYENVNLVTNGDFENGCDSGPSNSRLPGWTSANWSCVSFPYDDTLQSKVLKLSNDDSEQKPYVLYPINDVIPGITYQVTGKLKTESLTGAGSEGNSPAFKAQFYAIDPTTGNLSWNGQQLGENYGLTNGGWVNVCETFSVPLGTVQLQILVRMYGAGVVYYDDIVVTPVGEQIIGKVKNQCFVYSEWDTTDVNVTLFDSNVKRVLFSLSDNGNTLKEQEVVVSDSKASFIYPVSLLEAHGSEKGYLLTVTYKDEDGNIIGTPYEDVVYRYNRPSRINDKGQYVLDDGTIFKPVIGYSTWFEDLDNPKLQEVGVNVGNATYFRQYGIDKTIPQEEVTRPLNVEEMVNYINKAYENGIMTNVSLHANGKSAGAPDMIARTIEIVNAVKDLDGVFAYIIFDEPFTIGKLEILPYEDTVAQLKLASKTVRDLDPKHPIYLCECNKGYAYDSGRMVDILGVDPYPQTTPMALFCYNFVEYCREETQNLKPIYDILQAWMYGNWEPNANDLRHMAYQAFFAECEGIGYYTASEAWYKKALWDRICAPGAEALKNGEYEDAYKAFVTGEYPTFFEQSGDVTSPYWYKGFIKNGELYVAIMNTSNQAKNVSIPLTSWDGKISIGAFTATLADETSTFQDLTGNGTLSFALPGDAMLRIKITPSAAVDYSALTMSAFNDLNTAENANVKPYVDKAADVMTGTTIRKFSPAENIERGDYAQFLMDALNLTGEADTNFSDVPAFAPFANAIAVGKTLGIFVEDDDTFSPYDTLTFRDLYDITARGAMQLSNDFASADICYTVNSVMTSTGKTSSSIVTRGDAAMVLARIVAWKNNAGSAVSESKLASLANTTANFRENLAVTFSNQRLIKRDGNVWYTTWSDGEFVYAAAENNGATATEITLDTIYTSATPIIGDVTLNTTTGKATIPADTLCVWRISTENAWRLHLYDFPALNIDANVFVTIMRNEKNVDRLSALYVLSDAQKATQSIDIPLTYLTGNYKIDLLTWGANLNPLEEKFEVRPILENVIVGKDPTFDGDDFFKNDIFGQ